MATTTNNSHRALILLLDRVQILSQIQFTVPPSRHTVVVAENHQKQDEHQGQ